MYVMVLVTIVSVTVISVHVVRFDSNDRVVGRNASRTQPVHAAGVGVEVFPVISDVELRMLAELETVEELLSDPVEVDVVALEDELDDDDDEDDEELDDSELLCLGNVGNGGIEPVHTDEVEDEDDESDDDVDDEFTDLLARHRILFANTYNLRVVSSIEDDVNLVGSYL
jgi:hypothetical protein